MSNDFINEVQYDMDLQNKDNKNNLSVTGVVLAVVVVAALLSALVIYELIYSNDDSSVSAIYISEYMTSNTHYFDENGNSSDFIEIHNSSKNIVNLSGYVLAKGDKSYAFPFQFLKPDGYILVWLGNGGGTNHADFKLSKSGGETVSLINKRGTVIDEIVTMEHEKNFSVIREIYSDHQKEEFFCEVPTPGFPNTEEGAAAYLQTRFVKNRTGLFINEIMASNDTTIVDEFGECTDYVELYNSTGNDIDLSLFGITDELNNPFKYRFPENTVIKKKGYILLFLSSSYKTKDENGETALIESSNGSLLVPFSINKTQETICLTDGLGRFFESVTITDAKKDEALVRVSQNEEYQRTFLASPGYPNTEDGAKMAIKTYGQTICKDDIYISEASSRNSEYAKINNNYYDWIELYNPTNDSISLKGYSITDDSDEPKKYVFGDVVIGAGEYKVIYATDDKLKNAVSTGFKLNSNCAVFLYAPSGKRLDMVRLTELLKNVSKGRENGSNLWVYFTSPTPGMANENNGVEKISEPPIASEKSGQYNNIKSLKVTLSGDGEIFYTLDGSIPTVKSQKYSKAIVFKETGVLRAICKGEDSVMSSVSSYTYIINENHKMDVVSLVSNPDGLFSDKNGIYVTGSSASSEYPFDGANYYKDWKRECNLSLLPINEYEDGFTIDCETSIFGGATRAYDKRSLKFKFRDIYGSGKLRYKVFDNLDIDEFESIVVRANGQDTFNSMLKDDIMTSLARDELDVLATRSAVLYINGQYYGIFHIREKANADYVASHYNVSKESVDLLFANGVEVEAGSIDKWNEIKNFVNSHDMSKDENYAFIEERVDVKNYADYIIAELYSANTDTGNIRCFRSSENDGKFRWLFYDIDMGFQLYSKDTAWQLLNPAGTGASDAISTFLINGLLKNNKFRALFVERLEYQMDNVWNSERVIERIDEMAAVIRDEVPRNNKRWHMKQNWEYYIEALKTFAEKRPTRLKNELKYDRNVRQIIALTDSELDRCFKEAKDEM